MYPTPFSKLIQGALRLGMCLCFFVVIRGVSVAEEAPRTSALEKPQPNSSSANTVAMTTSMDVLNDVIKLGIGDRVSFRIVEDRRDPIPLIVTESGEMEIPLIGRVTANGKTCKQLAREIKPLLEKEYFYQATVIVGLDTIGTKSRGKIYLTGQVRSQGGMDIMPDEELTVSKAIMRAGGVADFGDRKKIKLIRKKVGEPSGTTTTILNLIDILEKGKIDKDIVVEPGDLIVVPEKLINF
jgi:protein involved in polysaccharide export with SLBB domain